MNINLRENLYRMRENYSRKPIRFKYLPQPSWLRTNDGPMPEALQDVNQKIFSEWLPAIREYEFAAGFCIEIYDDLY